MTCPALPALVSEGDTLDEARSMAADAIRLSKASGDDGLPLPPGEANPREVLRERITVTFDAE